MNSPRKKLTVPRPWGHEQFLTALIGKNVVVAINATSDAVTYKSKLIGFDRYTLHLELEDGKDFIVFKSSIESIGGPL